MKKIKSNIILILMVIVSISLCMPSILYLFRNKTVSGFNSYYTYLLNGYLNERQGLIDLIVVIGMILIFSMLYFIILKKENKIFKNNKQGILFICIISFFFMLILPFLSSDIYYYIGDSWLSAKYKANPYYTSVGDLQNEGINDDILENTGCWKDTTSVYGPLWNIISTLLVSFSFGNVTIALFIYKISNLILHILNSKLMYKITKSRKYMLLYGLNPLVLIEFLSNVHNDIYLILFLLIALYFLIRKKNPYFTMLFLSFSIAIKYSTVLIIPFILIYLVRKQDVKKRIILCAISGVAVIGMLVLLYLPYARDISVFTNMLVQGKKYSQSFRLFFQISSNEKVYPFIEKFIMPLFFIIYVVSVFILLFTKKLTMQKLMRRYNTVMIVFIFTVLTTFQSWYILWLLPTIIWQEKDMRKFILYLTTTAILSTSKYFIHGNDSFMYGADFSIKILYYSLILLFINMVINDIKQKKLVLKIRNDASK